MKLTRSLAAVALLLLAGCASVVPHNVTWAGHPVSSSTNGVAENDTVIVGLRDDGVVVWKPDPHQPKNVLHVK